MPRKQDFSDQPVGPSSSTDLTVDFHRAVRYPPAGRVIFVHGSMDTRRSFRDLRRHFTDWDTLSYDRRGYGGSLQGGEPPQVEDHLQDLGHLIGDEECVLFGHSLGGVICLMASAQWPRLVRSVICYEAPLPWLDWWPRAPLPQLNANQGVVLEAAAREAGARFLRRGMGEQAWTALSAERQEKLLRWAPAWAEELLELTDGGWPFEVQELEQEVLILHGSNSEQRHQQGSQEWLQHLPSATSIVVQGGTHNAHRRMPGALAEVARDFLSEQQNSL